MSAQAWYGTVGYIWTSLPWSPSISYRYASFSGDDPDTDTYERFDGLMTNGFGIWLQGMNFGKVYRNANLNTHRIQANLVPREGMNLTLRLASTAGRRVEQSRRQPGACRCCPRATSATSTPRRCAGGSTATATCSLSPPMPDPGDALRDIGADEPWTTLQASLYFSF
jgi:hypothetical protein